MLELQVLTMDTSGQFTMTTTGANADSMVLTSGGGIRYHSNWSSWKRY